MALNGHMSTGADFYWVPDDELVWAKYQSKSGGKFRRVALDSSLDAPSLLSGAGAGVGGGGKEEGGDASEAFEKYPLLKFGDKIVDDGLNKWKAKDGSVLPEYQWIRADDSEMQGTTVSPNTSMQFIY